MLKKIYTTNEKQDTKDVLMEYSEEQLEDLYDDLVSDEATYIIEAGDNELPEEGKITSDIITVLGNAIAEEYGYFDEWEDENIE